MIIQNAYAKINLFLDVTARREDGYHNILSLMHSVGLFDTLTLDGEISDKVEIILTTNAKDLAVDETNLVYRAALRYLSKFGIMARINIHLEKRIPTAAGLGGGSSDAAATLRAMHTLFGLGTQDELLTIAEGLGSDVPYCFIGGTAICTGRGEEVKLLSCNPKMHFVIAIGSERISTPEAYSALDNKYDFIKLGQRPDTDDRFRGIISNIESGKSVNGLLYNIFESVTELDDVEKIKETMLKNGAESVLMSGSGPSVFGVFESLDAAHTAENVLRNAGYTAYAVDSV